MMSNMQFLKSEDIPNSVPSNTQAIAIVVQEHVAEYAIETTDARTIKMPNRRTPFTHGKLAITPTIGEAAKDVAPKIV